MNFIVLTAVLSCLNSALYTTSRMLFALTRNGDAPKFFTKLSRNGVPRRAILLGTTIGYISVACTYVWGDIVFNFLVNSYGAVALFVYLLIAVSQVVLRRRLEREDPAALQLRMWLFPWLSYATIALMATVILAMAFLPSTRSQFLMSGLTLIAILISYEVRKCSARQVSTTNRSPPLPWSVRRTSPSRRLRSASSRWRRSAARTSSWPQRRNRRRILIATTGGSREHPCGDLIEL